MGARWVLGSAGGAVWSILPTSAWLLLRHWLPASVRVGRLPALRCPALLSPQPPRCPDRPPLFLCSRSLQPSLRGVRYSQLVVLGPGGWSWVPSSLCGGAGLPCQSDPRGWGWRRVVLGLALLRALQQAWPGEWQHGRGPPALPWGPGSCWCWSCYVLSIGGNPADAGAAPASGCGCPRVALGAPEWFFFLRSHPLDSRDFAGISLGILVVLV